MLLPSHLPFNLWWLAEVQQWTGAVWSLRWLGVTLCSTGSTDCEALRLKSGLCAFSSSCCLPFLFWRLLLGSRQITLRLNSPLTTAPAWTPYRAAQKEEVTFPHIRHILLLSLCSLTNTGFASLFTCICLPDCYITPTGDVMHCTAGWNQDGIVSSKQSLRQQNIWQLLHFMSWTRSSFAPVRSQWWWWRWHEYRNKTQSWFKTL